MKKSRHTDSDALKGQQRKHGMPPGSIVYVGEARTGAPGLHVIEYKADSVREQALDQARIKTLSIPQNQIIWLNTDGLHDTAMVEEIGRRFEIHSLTLADTVNTNQRPKIELFDNYLFITFKMLRLNGTQDGLLAEHVGMMLGQHFLLTFQEAPGDVFDMVRARIRSGEGRVRKFGADYLAYVLLDAVVDGYFLVLEQLGERIAELDEYTMSAPPDPATLKKIHDIKREMIFIRRSVWPMRELISFMQKMETGLLSDRLDIFLRDLYDHTVQVIDTVETYRELLSSLTDLYVSMVGNRMNEVMKVLTIIATIFIPLTFIAGVYGMNFTFMPELEWPWAYPAILGLMLITAGGMVVHFRRKGWL